MRKIIKNINMQQVTFLTIVGEKITRTSKVKIKSIGKRALVKQKNKNTQANSAQIDAL